MCRSRVRELERQLAAQAAREAELDGRVRDLQATAQRHEDAKAKEDEREGKLKVHPINHF